MPAVWNKDREQTDPDVAATVTYNDLVVLLWVGIFVALGFTAGYFACTKKKANQRRRR